MARIADPPARTYRSRLRADQARETRDRILDATVRVMAGGLASTSIPAVAREAGVSVPTVYRHFRTKGDLLAAVYPHVARRAGIDDGMEPRTLDELREGLRRVFERIDAMDDLARAAMASPGADEVRHATMPSRLARIRRLVDAVAPALPAEDRARLVRLLVIVTSSSSLRVWRDHLGASVDEAVADIDWLLRVAIARNDR